MITSEKVNTAVSGAAKTAATTALNLLCLISLLVVIACSDSDSGDGSGTISWSNADILAVIPGQTRWAMAIDLQVPGADELTSGINAALESPRVQDPLFAAFASLLDSATAGLSPTEDFTNFTLNYLVSPEPSLLVLGVTHEKSLNLLFGSDELVFVEKHRGVYLYSNRSSSVIAVLPGMLLAIGTTATIRAAIDQYYEEGQADTAVVNTLASEIEQGPIAFAFELADAQSPELQPGDVPSLETAELLSGALNPDADNFSGSVRFKMSGADIFVKRFSELTNDSYAGRVASPATDVLEVDVSFGVDESVDRFLLKQLSFGMDGIEYAENTGVGKNFPWLTFSVLDQPSSIFINYRFASEEKRIAFERDVLPMGFRLKPLKILSGEKSQYFLVLNLYGSSGGLVEGARAEWSVFVEDPESGVPRFLVVEAVAASLAADPVNLLTLPEPVDHESSGGKIRSYVGRDSEDGSEATYFESFFDWPQVMEQTQKLDPEFAVANDYIFWGNGVADRGLYNGSVHARDIVVIDPATFEQEDNSVWSQYIDSTPQHVLSYRNALEFVISPWANLDAAYLDLTESHLQNLIKFSNDFYPLTAKTQALASFNGIGDVTRPRMEATESSSIYFHFPIIDVDGMSEALESLGDRQLAEITISADGKSQHYLSLRVYSYEGDSCGVRADWLTYVVSPETALVESLTIDSLSSESCIDVESLFRPAAQVEHSLKSGRSYIQANGLDTHFSASVDPEIAVDIVADTSWIAAGDEQCSLYGFCDRYFYNGDTLMANLVDVDASAVDITTMETPWNPFVSTQPGAVIVRGTPRLLLTLPWSNVKPARPGGP